ncbi:DNA-helicase RecQ [Sesbania bispinosa]|nr:DNA-helicase RecQ [Sesbania bispinosa]
MDTNMKGGYGGEPLLVVVPDTGTGTGWSSRDSATVKRHRGEVHDEPGRGAGEERTHEDGLRNARRRCQSHDCGSVGALQGGAAGMNAQCGTTTTMVRN